jgi:hypothetical protein
VLVQCGSGFSFLCWLDEALSLWDTQGTVHVQPQYYRKFVKWPYIVSYTLHLIICVAVSEFFIILFSVNLILLIKHSRRFWCRALSGVDFHSWICYSCSDLGCIFSSVPVRRMWWVCRRRMRVKLVPVTLGHISFYLQQRPREKDVVSVQEEDALVLSPQRRSFLTGCQAAQVSSLTFLWYGNRSVSDRSALDPHSMGF